MSVYVVQGDTLTSLADAVRSKTGLTNAMTLNEIATAIDGYESEDTSAEIVDGSVVEYSNDVVTKVGFGAFAYCSSLTTVSFPACTSIGSYAFYNCTKLTSVSFPVCTLIEMYAFRNCTSLTSLYLAGSSLCSLYGSNAFTSTPIASGTGYIYVPSSLAVSYRAATNWAYYSAQIKSI